MTIAEAKRIMEIERTCVLRQDTPECGRDEYGCGACDLVQSSDDVIEAYGVAIKALEQEPCEDEYIKVPKKALKYRTAGMVAYNAEWLKNNFDIERAVICGTQEPCEDCISRKDTLKKFKQIYFDNDTVIRCAELILGSMPPVTPQPKTGHWIIEKWNNKEHYSCSSCQHVVDYEPCYHYCPYCGAKMIGSQESENKKEESEKEKYRLLLAFMSGLISNKEEREKALDYIEDMMSKE